MSELSEFPFVEIVEEGACLLNVLLRRLGMGRVVREAIESVLPSVLVFELSRV